MSLWERFEDRVLVPSAEVGERFFTRLKNPLRPENYYDYRPVERRNDPQAVHKHWVVFLLPGLEGLAALALFVVWLNAAGADSLEAALFVSGVIALHAAYRAVEERKDVFVLTIERVFRVSGIVDQTKATAPVARLLDITVKKPFIGRILGYGHLILETAAQEQGLRVIRFVPNPDEVNLWIDNVRAGRTPLDNPRQP